MTPTISATTTCQANSDTKADAGTLMVGPSSIKRNSLNFEGRCVSHTNGLPLEIIQFIAMQCLPSSGVAGFMALSYTNVHCYIGTQKLLNKRNLIQLCPGLTILDGNTLKYKGDDEPCIDKLSVFKYFWKFAPYVENNAGLTLMTKFKDLTFNQLMEFAKMKKIGVKICGFPILEQLDGLAPMDTCRVMITNGPVTETRNKSRDMQEKRVLELGFDGSASLYESFQFFIFAQIASSEQKVCPFGQKAYVRSSTLHGSFPLAIGCPIPNSINVCIGEYDDKNLSAAGKKKF